MEARSERSDRTAKALRLLVAEDEPDLRDVLLTGLSRLGVQVFAAADGEEALATLAREAFDIVVLDLRMPKVGGIEVLQQMRADGHDAETIIITGHADVDTAIEAVKLQAFDYLTKPFRVAELAAVVERAAERRRLRRENRVLRRAVSQHEAEPVMLGASPAMDRLRTLLERAARSQSHVLILGESGSGKELAARAIHRDSSRRDLPFLAINCAAMPNELLESELFGHEKGAFTGAAARRQGLLELAHEGTLFLDELGEMSLAMQAKLLRAIDRGEIRRLGGDRTHYVDVRIIASTNKDLGRAVAAGEFRQDLFYRLSVVVIEVPALRERAEDIGPLAEHFARTVAGAAERRIKFSADALDLLGRHRWPGNVRELRNVVERLIVLGSSAEVTAAELALFLPTTAAAPGAPAGSGGGLLTLEEMERQHILHVLQNTGGNRARAAKILGVDPKTLYNKMKVYEGNPDRPFQAGISLS